MEKTEIDPTKVNYCGCCEPADESVDAKERKFCGAESTEGPGTCTDHYCGVNKEGSAKVNYCFYDESKDEFKTVCKEPLKDPIKPEDDFLACGKCEEMPSMAPSPAVTVSSSISSAPSLSTEPSILPTQQPSVFPSEQPSLDPSGSPTLSSAPSTGECNNAQCDCYETACQYGVDNDGLLYPSHYKGM